MPAMSKRNGFAATLPTAAAAIVLMLASACTTRPAPPAHEATLYERLGGRDAIAAMVDDSIGYISADRRINQRFANVSGEALKRNLVDFICERTGGPCVYRGKNMADAHEGMFVRDDEFDALVEDMGKAMGKAGVGARERTEVAGLLAKLRNSVTGH
jgi:hemoglobin